MELRRGEEPKRRAVNQDREEEVRGTESDIGSTAAPAETGRPEEGEQEEEAASGKSKRLSPRQRFRRQSLARQKNKQWVKEWMLEL